MERFNPAVVAGLMCRHLVSVDWQGRVYDCELQPDADLRVGGGDGLPAVGLTA